MSRISHRQSILSIGAAAGLTLACGWTLHAVARQVPSAAAAHKAASPSKPANPGAAGNAPTPGTSKSSLASPGSPAAAPSGHATLDFDDADGAQKTGIVSGKKFIYREEDRIATGDTARYNQKTLEMDAEGNLVMDDPKEHITCTKCHLDRNKRLSILTGSVVIDLKPKPQPAGGPAGDKTDDVAKERAQGVRINCDRADDYYKKDFIVLTGHLVFTQKIKKDDGTIVERTLTAEHAEYDGKKEEMVLFTPVKGHDSDGRTSEFETNVIVGTKEGEETLTTHGKTHASFPLDDVKDEDAKNPATPTAPTAPPVK